MKSQWFKNSERDTLNDATEKETEINFLSGCHNSDVINSLLNAFRSNKTEINRSDEK